MQWPTRLTSLTLHRLCLPCFLAVPEIHHAASAKYDWPADFDRREALFARDQDSESSARAGIGAGTATGAPRQGHSVILLLPLALS
jgi:hypothetical protein